MKALVTGGGGFLGRAIVEMLLGRGDSVRFISRQSYPIVEALGAEGIQGDIRKLDDVVNACMGIDTVFHAAALPGVWGDWDTYYGINVLGTQNVIEACKRRGVSKLVYTSSPSVVFNMKADENADETAPYPPKFYNPYSHTKAIAEQIVLENSGQDGLLCCSLRPHLIWGPRDNHIIPRILSRARSGQLRIIGKGATKVHITYVENAAMGHILAADAMTAGRVSGQIYFLGDAEPIVLWQWINTLLERLGMPPVKKHIPVSIAYGLGACMEAAYTILKKKEEPRMTRFLARSLSCSHYFKLDKARKDFGYKPAISNEEGMRRTVEYFRAQGQRLSGA